MNTSLLIGRSKSQTISWLSLWSLYFIFTPNGVWGDELQEQLGNWGSDHVGQELPSYVTGDECLFCHRNIGATWQENPHQTTIRLADARQPEIRWLSESDPASAGEVHYLMGAERIVRFLKRNEAYGKLDMLSARYRLQVQADSSRKVLREAVVPDCNNPHWDNTTFADRCIGCHTTATDSQQKTFAATSLDCHACHGEVDLAHTADVSIVLLSRHPQNALIVNSICSSCHLRGGQSTSTGLPYPNTFVPGDNLFRDYDIDLSDKAVRELSVMQRHIYLSARSVGSGKDEPSCIDCHSLHGNSSQQHGDQKHGDICSSCHVEGSQNSQLRDEILQFDRLNENNKTCDY